MKMVLKNFMDFNALFDSLQPKKEEIFCYNHLFSLAAQSPTGQASQIWMTFDPVGTQWARQKNSVYQDDILGKNVSKNCKNTAANDSKLELKARRETQMYIHSWPSR